MRSLFFLLFIFPLCAARIPGKVTICGVCKNVETAIPHTIANIETLGGLFDDYRVFIYENNSKDKSAALLKGWTERNGKVRVTSELVNDEILSKTCFNKTIQNEFYRPEMIARARNIALDQAMDAKYDNYDYLIWVDLDFEHELPFEAIVATFQSKQEWDAVFANGVDDKGNFYDTYSLRDAIYPVGAELIGNQWWEMRGKKGHRFDKKDRWFPVISAFGGMGIYKRKAIQGCRYSAIVTEDLETIATRIIEQGKKKKHPEILLYLKELSEMKHIIRLTEVKPEMTYYRDHSACGFLLGKNPDGLIFRMNSGVCQYPSICEHVPFHASMILRGHDKLFINPAIVLHYFGRT